MGEVQRAAFVQYTMRCIDIGNGGFGLCADFWMEPQSGRVIFSRPQPMVMALAVPDGAMLKKMTANSNVGSAAVVAAHVSEFY